MRDSVTRIRAAADVWRDLVVSFGKGARCVFDGVCLKAHRAKRLLVVPYASPGRTSISPLDA